MMDNPTTDTESNSYEITVTRSFEVDISEEGEERLMAQMGVDDSEKAVELSLMQSEKQNVSPEEKLLMVEVNADGPSDD
jgi:hypothetical protein